MKKQFVTDLQSKDDVDSVFLVKHIAVMEGKDGKNYLNVVFSDSTGDLEARKWNGGPEITQSICKGDYAFVTGKMNSFQGRLQLIIKDISKANLEGIEVTDFIPKSSTDSDTMLDELISLVETLDDVYIKDLLRIVLNDMDIQRRLKVWYAGKTIHHAYESGLLEHILDCTRLAFHLSAFYKVNRNYVVAGAIMHDLCKIYELTEGPMVDYTDEGKLVGHLVKSIEMLEHFTHKLRGFPANTKMHLKHILISHHGEYEYGSPKVPSTSEAYLVHLIDLMDSKMNSVFLAKKADKNSGKWTGVIKHLERTLYKGELPFYADYLPDQNQVQQRNAEASQAQAILANSKKDKPVSTEGHLTFTLASKLEKLKGSGENVP